MGKYLGDDILVKPSQWLHQKINDQDNSDILECSEHWGTRKEGLQYGTFQFLIGREAEATNCSIKTSHRESVALESADFLMDDFLASVEQQSYRIAFMALSDHDEALDVMQDAMISLVTKYRYRPESEWRTLFFSILHNRITDSHRKNNRRRRLFGWFDRNDFGGEIEAIKQVEGDKSLRPGQSLQNSEAMTLIQEAVRGLTLRQQEAFMLRTVEGFDTNETAKIMGCSEGSVKTHLSRALSMLKEDLNQLR